MREKNNCEKSGGGVVDRAMCLTKLPISRIYYYRVCVVHACECVCVCACACVARMHECTCVCVCACAWAYSVCLCVCVWVSAACFQCLFAVCFKSVWICLPIVPGDCRWWTWHVSWSTLASTRSVICSGWPKPCSASWTAYPRPTTHPCPSLWKVSSCSVLAGSAVSLNTCHHQSYHSSGTQRGNCWRFSAFDQYLLLSFFRVIGFCCASVTLHFSLKWHLMDLYVLYMCVCVF